MYRDISEINLPITKYSRLGKLGSVSHTAEFINSRGRRRFFGYFESGSNIPNGWHFCKEAVGVGNYGRRRLDYQKQALIFEAIRAVNPNIVPEWAGIVHIDRVKYFATTSLRRNEGDLVTGTALADQLHTNIYQIVQRMDVSHIEFIAGQLDEIVPLITEATWGLFKEDQGIEFGDDSFFVRHSIYDDTVEVLVGDLDNLSFFYNGTSFDNAVDFNFENASEFYNEWRGAFECRFEE